MSIVCVVFLALAADLALVGVFGRAVVVWPVAAFFLTVIGFAVRTKKRFSVAHQAWPTWKVPHLRVVCVSLYATVPSSRLTTAVYPYLAIALIHAHDSSWTPDPNTTVQT